MKYQILSTLLFVATSACPTGLMSGSWVLAIETNRSHLVRTFVLPNDGETPQDNNNPGAGTSQSPKSEQPETAKRRKQKRKKENTKSSESPVQLVPGLPPGIPVPLVQLPAFSGESPRPQNNPLVPQSGMFPPIRPIPQVDKNNWHPDALRAFQEHLMLLGNIDKSLKSIDQSLKSMQSMMLNEREKELLPGTPRPSKPREPTDRSSTEMATPSGYSNAGRLPYRGAPPPRFPSRQNTAEPFPGPQENN